MQPIQTLMNTGKGNFHFSQKAFEQFDGKHYGVKIDLFKHKLMYMAIHGLNLSIALYKLYSIGFIPLHASDWVDLVPKHQQPEEVYILNESVW